MSIKFFLSTEMECLPPLLLLYKEPKHKTIEINYTMTKPVRPAKKLMIAGAKCSVEGLAYGKCMSENYSTASQNACQKEFSIFKQCVDKSLKK